MHGDVCANNSPFCHFLCSFFFNHLLSTHDSLWWKDLKEIWGSEGWGRNFGVSLFWKIGNGKDICFGEDNWVGCGDLKSTFSRLYSLSTLGDSKLVEYGSWVNGGWVWHVAWRMRLFEREKQLESCLLQEIQGLRHEVGLRIAGCGKMGSS